MRAERITPRFVEFVPDALEHGVVYIAIAYGAVIHACCCGCGEKVATPLGPAEWSLTYNGEEITLDPSIGNGALPCRSHYFITRNEVRWARPLSKAQTTAALQRDATAVAEYYQSKTPPAAPSDWRDRVRKLLRLGTRRG
jgi:hypothetical protein